MSTVVTVEVVERGRSDRAEIDRAIAAAFDWFDVVERTCSRFLETSEACRLSARVGAPVPVSELLFETVAFACATAAESGGAFDPTMGLDLAARGFNREHRSTDVVTHAADGPTGATYRDVVCDRATRCVTLLRPLLLDLGGVAKGLAVDLAARELAPFEHYAIDAGGDVFVAGRNVDDEPWAIGIRHPRSPGTLAETVRVSDAAVCTSGDYERRQPGANDGHHILDPRTRASVAGVASVSVRAPRAIVADALATAAFVMGPADGMAWIGRQGAEGLLFTPDLERLTTEAW